MAIEATQAAAQKDEDLAKAKASRAETKKLADSSPLRKPAAPATALRQITGKVTDENGQPLIGQVLSSMILKTFSLLRTLEETTR
ncbi:MAG: hypothetical protein IPM82_18545 [Saprospiraceae bacterium]|nr:hypothetical protein [Saprospiraceae bacterium]